MKVMIFSDIHGDLRALERALAQAADIYIACGDLSTFGKGLERCGPLLAPLGERAWILPGNHESHADTKAFCREFGLVDFHRQIRKVGSSVWAGLGCGGGGGGGGGAPAGNYTVTVTATDSSNSNITASTTFTLTIQ